MYKILFVDDETANLRLLERIFRNSYEVFVASTGEEALETLATHDISLIVSDQRMPSMTGLEFLKLAAERRPQTLRILLTGYTDVNDLVDAINSGVVYKYITKPWVNEELMQTVKRALQHYETMKGQRQLQLQTERLQSRLRQTRDGFIEFILSMLDNKIPSTRQHAERTAALAAAVGEKFEMEYQDRDVLILAARLHDAPLHCVPRNIVLKVEPLTDEEAEVGARYLESSVEMLKKIPDLEEAAGLLRFQYERFDGTGQPVGFSREQIPLNARIIAVVDAYDKMRHPQSDAIMVEHDDAIALLNYESGKKYDPRVIGALQGLPIEKVIGKVEPSAQE